jgi:hypothetical protein
MKFKNRDSNYDEDDDYNEDDNEFNDVLMDFNLGLSK